MKIKRILCVILAMTVLLCGGGVTSVSADTTDNNIVSADTKPNVTWNYDSKTATLTFSGEGDIRELMDTFETPWEKYENDIQYINLTENIFSSKEKVFSKYPNLVSVDVDKNNPYYTSENGVLFNKNRTELFVYPSCKTDSTYVVPSTVKTIEDYSFYTCNKLEKITIPNGVKKIPTSCFEKCKNLKSVVLPNSIIEISFNAFEDCENLTNITISNNVKVINFRAFKNCTSLKSVYIPKATTTLYNETFSNCTDLESINIDRNNKKYTSVGGVLFDKKKVTLIQYPPSKKATSFTVPNTVKTIKSEAFSYSKYLKLVTIQNSVTNLDSDAFSSCVNLEKVTLPNSIKVIKDGVFSNCTKLKYINIPNSVKEIQYYAFSHCESLKNVIIPNSVTYIGQGTFEECSNLETVTIPNSVSYIDYSCFFCDDKLKDIYYKGSKAQWYSIMVCHSYNNPYDEDKDLYMGDDKEFNIGVNATIHFELKDNEVYVRKSLSNVNISNKNNIINKNKTYSTKLTPKKGYAITGVSVTMNGKAIKTSFNGKSCNIKISKVNGDITIFAKSKKTQTISVKKSFTKKKGCKPFYLKAKAKTKLTYSSSNKKVATVNSKGKVTVKRVGKTIITIKAISNSTYVSDTKRIAVTVKKK